MLLNGPNGGPKKHGIFAHRESWAASVGGLFPLGRRCVWEASLVQASGWHGPRVETVTAAHKLLPRRRLCELGNIPETETRLRCGCPAYKMCKDSLMFEFVVAVAALSSASIFFAHIVDAYVTR